MASHLSLDKALGIAKHDLTVGNGVSYADAKAYFTKVVYNKRAMKQRANSVYRAYAKKLLAQTDAASFDGAINLPIGQLKQKIKLDAEKHAKVNPYGKLEYSSTGQALMDALQYD